MKFPIFLLLFLTVLISSCADFSDFDQIETTDYTSEFLIPVIDSKLNIVSLLDSTNTNISFRIEPDGRVNSVFSGEGITINTQQIIPLIPVLADIPILDTLSLLQIPSIPGATVSKAILKNTGIRFKLMPGDQQKYEVDIALPEFIKEGKPFTAQITIPQNSQNSIFESESFDISGYTAEKGLSQVKISYQAKDESGINRILERAFLRVDFLQFSYLEGIFPNQEFSIPSGTIPVNSFQNWVSGTANFSDPSIEIIVDNSFGIPVAPTVNALNIIANNGEIQPLTTNAFDQLIFDFPTLEEVGAIKTTTVILDKTNSNILDIINEQTKDIEYDIDAIAFPNFQLNETGFILDDSEVNLESNLVLPLQGVVNEFVLQEQYDIESIDFQQAIAAEFILNIDNQAPVDLGLQIFLVDAVGSTLDSIFSEGEILVPAANLITPSSTTSQGFRSWREQYSNERLRNIENTKRAIARIRLDMNADEPIWLYDYYEMEMNLGVALEINR